MDPHTCRCICGRLRSALLTQTVFRFCLQVCLLASGFPRLRESIVS
ncbi:hypothetical protein DWX55_01380 [Collinsella sp. AF19-7AC]|nr:hypothetical protein DWX55_01380 [Collinsella sp. AF19-7AC]RGT33593.1 hypothetical protein DWX39_00995 [Collinsella sp. AF19-1LB]RGX17051.1 hypothetical protein DWV32_05000 [Collinsella sp. AF04-24]RHE30297.1 hypothetical protein DW754_01255 [Collinsella sp. AM29-10AC]